MAPPIEDEECLVKGTQVTQVTKTTRPFVIETLVVLFVVSGFPMMSLTSQFLVHKVAETMGYDYAELTKQLNDHGANDTSTACTVNLTSPDYIALEQVQGEAANWNMYKALAFFLPGMVAPVVMGSLADRVGRRMLFIMPCIGSLISVVVYMLMIKLNLPLWMVFFEVLDYMFGSMGVLFTGAYAYITDTVPAERRAFRITLLDAVLMVNGAVALLAVGYWIRAQGFFWPLVFVLVGKCLTLLYAIFLVPETLPKDQDKPVSRREDRYKPSTSHEDTDKPAPRRKIQPKDMVSALKLSLYDDGKGRRWKINTLMLSFTFAELITTFSVMTMYEMNAPLCWGPVKIAYYGAVTMLLQSLTMLIAAYIPGHRISPEWKVVISRVSGIASGLYIAFCTSDFMMYFAPVVGAFSFLALPMMRYLLSSLVGAHEQASMFGLLSVVWHMTQLFSSLATNKIYEETLYIMHGSVVFLCSSGTLSVSLALIGFYMLLTRKSTKPLLVEENTGSIQ